MFVLNIRSLVFLDITFDLHTGISMANAVLAFPILICMSWSDLPSLLMLLPRLMKFSASSIASPPCSSFSAFLVLINPHHFRIGFADPKTRLR